MGIGAASGEAVARHRALAAAPWVSAVSALLVAVVPKCPVCFAAYGAVFSWPGLAGIVESHWLRTVTAAAFAIAAVYLLIRGVRAEAWGGLAVLGVGSAGVVSGATGLFDPTLTWLGATAAAIGAFWTARAVLVASRHPGPAESVDVT